MAVDDKRIRLFNAAFEEIEHSVALDTDPESEPKLTAFVFSGGAVVGARPEHIPGLFTTDEAAIAAFRHAAVSWLKTNGALKYRLTEAPKVERFHMTETDDMKTQRITVMRYGVTCCMAITQLDEKTPAVFDDVPLSQEAVNEVFAVAAESGDNLSKGA